MVRGRTTMVARLWPQRNQVFRTWRSLILQQLGHVDSFATLYGNAPLATSSATAGGQRANTMASVSWSNFARYVLIAAVALLIGIAINLAMGNGLGGQDFFNPAFYLLVTEYGIFHVVALSITAILAAIFSPRLRSILYLSLSVLGFLVSIFVFNPSKYGGVHLFIICWGSLVLIALDYVWRTNRHRPDGELSST